MEELEERDSAISKMLDVLASAEILEIYIYYRVLNLKRVISLSVLSFQTTIDERNFIFKQYKNLNATLTLC